VSDYWSHPKVAEIFDAVAIGEYDLDFYRQRITPGGSVAELGAGTGRVAIPLAQSGYNVVGIDSAKPLIERARQKAESVAMSGTADFRVGDMAELADDEAFDAVIFPDYSFAYLLEQERQIECLTNVRKALKPEGKVLLHLFQPNPTYFGSLSLGGVGGRVNEVGALLHLEGGGQLMISTSSRYDRASQKIYSVKVFEELFPDGRVKKIALPILTHVYYRMEMELLFRHCGFEVKSIYGDFQGGEMCNDSSEMIFEATVAV
jgi:SAM-dependent methyltransferase